MAKKGQAASLNKWENVCLCYLLHLCSDFCSSPIVMCVCVREQSGPTAT